MTEEQAKNPTEAGQDSYSRWKAGLATDPEYQEVYEEEAAKSDLWLQLVEARQALGLTQEEMARRLGVHRTQVVKIERQGYDAYTLNTLRRYVRARGGGYHLEVHIQPPSQPAVAESRCKYG